MNVFPKCQILCTTRDEVSNLLSIFKEASIEWASGNPIELDEYEIASYLPHKYVQIGYWDEPVYKITQAKEPIMPLGGYKWVFNGTYDEFINQFIQEPVNVEVESYL